MDGAAVPNAVDTHEEDELFAVLRLRQDQDRPNLCHGLRQDRCWQRRCLARLPRQIALVRGDVLDTDDTPVRFELGDPIHEQEGIPVRQNTLDRAVIEGKCQRLHSGQPV